MRNYFYLKLLTTVALLSAILNAQIYEDAEDGTTKGWHIYDSTPFGATISNIVEDSGNHAIKLQGSKKDNGFILGEFYHYNTGAWHNKTEKTIRWRMKYDEPFEVFISVQTKRGHRFIVYSNEETDRGLVGTYIRYGLGENSKNGKWKTFTRNLTDDLQKYEPNNTILSVNGFLVRGSGLIDDIQMGKTNNPISNSAPTVSIEDDKNTTIGKTIKIVATAKDHDGTIVSYEWKQGDTVLATTPILEYTATNIGVNTLTLTVTDDDEAIASDTINILVNPIEDLTSIQIGAREVKSTPLQKGNIFIAPNGSGNRCTKTDPCSFADLVRYDISIKAGYVVFFREGIYSLKSLGKWNPVGNVTYESYPGEMATIDGGNKWWTYIKVPNVTFRRMTFQNSRAYGIQIKSSYNKIEGCIIKNNQLSGIEISNDGKVQNDPRLNSFNIIKDNIIHDNSDEFANTKGDNADGIAIHYGMENVIEHNTIYNNSDDGIDGFASINTTISYNLVYSNGKGLKGNGNGIKLTSASGNQGRGYNQTARHNIVYNNRANGITSQGYSTATIIYNTAYNNAMGNSMANNYTTNKFTDIRMNIADSDFPLKQYRGRGLDNREATNIKEKNICAGYINKENPLIKNFLKPLPT